MTSQTTNRSRDVTLGVSVVLSTVSLVLLLVVTCYFQTSLKTLEQQVELDKELLLQLQNQVRVRTNMMQFMKKAVASMVLL